MKLFSNLNHIPWKYVAGMNIAILALAVSFVSINSINKTTEHRSQAKEALPSPLAQISVDQSRPPKLINPDVSWGKIGDDIVVKGENLGTKPFGVLRLGDTPIASTQLVEWSDNQIVFTIPAGAKTGLITLTAKTTTGQELNLSTSSLLEITTTNKQ